MKLQNNLFEESVIYIFMGFYGRTGVGLCPVCSGRAGLSTKLFFICGAGTSLSLLTSLTVDYFFGLPNIQL